MSVIGYAEESSPRSRLAGACLPKIRRLYTASVENCFSDSPRSSGTRKARTTGLLQLQLLLHMFDQFFGLAAAVKKLGILDFDFVKFLSGAGDQARDGCTRLRRLLGWNPRANQFSSFANDRDFAHSGS